MTRTWTSVGKVLLHSRSWGTLVCKSQTRRQIETRKFNRLMRKDVLGDWMSRRYKDLGLVYLFTSIESSCWLDLIILRCPGGVWKSLHRIFFWCTLGGSDCKNSAIRGHHFKGCRMIRELLHSARWNIQCVVQGKTFWYQVLSRHVCFRVERLWSLKSPPRPSWMRNAVLK